MDQASITQLIARNHWVCVLNPSEATLERLKPLLAEAYDRAVKRYAKSRPSREAS